MTFYKSIVPEDKISGTLTDCIMLFLLTFNKLYKKVTLLKNKKEKTMMKASAAKIVSLAAFHQVRNPLFPCFHKVFVLRECVFWDSDG